MSETTPDLEEFRQRARRWFAANMPPRPATRGFDYGNWERCRELQSKLYQAGFAGVCFPTEYGGLGLPYAYQQALDEETMAYEMPLSLNSPTLGIIAPTILQFGTEEQKRRYIPPMLRGEKIWIQFLSEPTSGSDLASVTTRATLDGDAFVVNGSKIWSSNAEGGDYALCVTRTSWSVPKHDGITVLLMEIGTPGITIERIIDVQGGDDFCQEFFDDVRVPVENVLGQVDGGWTVVQGLLKHERDCTGGGSIYANGRYAQQDSGTRSQLLEFVLSARCQDDPIVRQHLGEEFTLTYVQEQTQRRIVGAMEKGRMPPAAGAMLRLLAGVFSSRRSDLNLEVTGDAAAACRDDDLAGAMASHYIGRQRMEMAGGTTEMQRNIISERLLQMPREYAADRGVPFDEVRHNAPPKRGK